MRIDREKFAAWILYLHDFVVTQGLLESLAPSVWINFQKELLILNQFEPQRHPIPSVSSA